MSYNNYDESVWFKLYREKLENDFNPSTELKLDPNIKHACVAAIIRLNPNYPSNEDIAPFDILFIQRAIKKGDPWSGQIALPGGRHEGTETLQQTAERETMEEIGLDIGRHEETGHYKCIGYCNKMDITRGKYTLRVISFIFFQCIKQTPKFNIHKKEVNSVAWINFNQLTKIPFTVKDKNKYVSMIKLLKDDKISISNHFSSRHSHAWSNMMVNSKLNEQIKFINDKMDYCHCDLFLEFQHMLIPRNLTKYPAVILKTGIENNNYWLLWGLTYRMIGFILTAMNINHYLRYKRISKGSWLLGTQLMYFAREYFGLKLQWRSAGIEPYFAKILKAKL
eukprot:406352_1